MGVRDRFAAAVAACLILLACSTSAVATSNANANAKATKASVDCVADDVQPTTATAGDAAFALLCQMNELRAQNGLRPLRWDWRLWVGAQRHANDMAAQHYFSHTSLDGRGLQERIQPTGYIPINPNWMLGENLGFGTNRLSTPVSIAIGWMDSEFHRENLLDPTFRDAGVGVAEGSMRENGQTGIVYVVDFGMRTDDVVRSRGRNDDTGRSRGRADDTVRPRGRSHRARRR